MQGAGRGRGTELNKPAWMTTGNLGEKPEPTTEGSGGGEAVDAMAAELRGFASRQSSSSDDTTAGRKRKKDAEFADAEEEQKRAKGMADDFLGQLDMSVGEPVGAAAPQSPAVLAARGRGRGTDLNKPAWLTTGDLGSKPEATISEVHEEDGPGLSAADLRQFATSSTRTDSATAKKPRTAGPEGIVDARFQSNTKLELLQLLAVIPGVPTTARAATKYEGLLKALRAAVPN